MSAKTEKKESKRREVSPVGTVNEIGKPDRLGTIEAEATVQEVTGKPSGKPEENGRLRKASPILHFRETHAKAIERLEVWNADKLAKGEPVKAEVDMQKSFRVFADVYTLGHGFKDGLYDKKLVQEEWESFAEDFRECHCKLKLPDGFELKAVHSRKAVLDKQGELIEFETLLAVREKATSETAWEHYMNELNLAASRKEIAYDRAKASLESFREEFLQAG